MTVGILHPNSGNITSMRDAVARLGLDYRVLKSPELDGIEHLVLPGQGRFGSVMRFLRENQWIEPLQDWLAADKPLTAICVGMQILFESGEEDPDETGLGIFPGTVQALDSPKRPMMGWARVDWRTDRFPEGAAYFVNGYVARDCPASIATCDYGQTFCAALQRGRLTAFQFHPEKSGVWGKEVMRRCLAY